MPVRLNAAIPARSSLAADSPEFERTTFYVDSTGVVTGEPRISKRFYNATGAAITLGSVCLRAEDGDEETAPALIALAAGTVPLRCAVAAEAIPIASYGEAYIEGWCNALCHGTIAVVKDQFLKTVAGTITNAFVSEGATAQSAKSAAVAAEGFSSAGQTALKKVYLLNELFDPD